MSLPEQLLEAVAALRAGRVADAVSGLGPVWDDAELAAADDLQDVRARVGSLYAQALLEAGDVVQADAVCRATIRLLRRMGDPDGVHAVRELQDRVSKALAEHAEHAQRLAEARQVAATPLATLMAGADDGEARAAALVRKATAHADAGDSRTAADLAAEALGVARAHHLVTWEVFARLLIVRCDPEDDLAVPHLHAAHRVAVGAEEFNLVSTVVRAAEVAGLPLPVEHGPHLGKEGA